MKTHGAVLYTRSFSFSLSRLFCSWEPRLRMGRRALNDPRVYKRGRARTPPCDRRFINWTFSGGPREEEEEEANEDDDACWGEEKVWFYLLGWWESFVLGVDCCCGSVYTRTLRCFFLFSSRLTLTLRGSEILCFFNERYIPRGEGCIFFALL